MAAKTMIDDRHPTVANGRADRLPSQGVQDWLPLVALPTVVLLFAPATWPRWGVMWTLAAALFVGCKWLTWRRSTAAESSLGRRVGYWVAWPGLDADAFLDSRTVVDRPTWSEWFSATAKTACGLALIDGVVPRIPMDAPFVAGWVGMIGIVLTLHFGLFHLLSCAWRNVGVAARPLMDRPLLAESVAEFWGRRWNTAFRDLTHRFLFRPLSGGCGPRAALAIGFLASGLVHDLVISVPAGGGYGGPTAYFLLQGLAAFAERSRLGRRCGLGRGVRGWTFASLVVLGPVGLCFHRPFVIETIVPFLHAIGALR